MPVFTNFDSFHMEFIQYTSPLLLLSRHTCSHPDCLTHTDSRDGLRKQLCVCVSTACTLYTVHLGGDLLYTVLMLPLHRQDPPGAGRLQLSSN